MPPPPRTPGRVALVWLASAVLAALTGCEALKGTASPPPPAPAPAASGSEPVGRIIVHPPQPAASAPAEAPPAAEPAPPAPPQGPREIQALLGVALEHLQAGNEAAAVVELERVLQAEPNQRAARSLLRQVREDPQALLGRESFAYRVQAGDTLSALAQRFLNDLNLFYALARYNGIKVPRLLAEGQVLRIPGTASAPTPAIEAPAAMPAPAASAELTPAQRTQAIQKWVRDARRAFARQNLDAAIKAWDTVLALDPDHRVAQLERQKAVELKQRLERNPR